MGHFYYTPKAFNDKAVGFYTKIMGYSLETNKSLTLWSNKIYPSEDHILNSFAQTIPYYFTKDKKIVCSVYSPKGKYQFSLIRDPKTGKFNRLNKSDDIPDYMSEYEKDLKGKL